jgi:electron transport complex protein RnfG
MNAWRNMLRTAVIMSVFSLFFTALMALVYEMTHTIVVVNEEKAKLALLEQVLPRDSYDNNLLHTTLSLSQADAQKLGNEGASQVYLAKKNGRTENIIVEATAPDGYGGNIRLLVGINRAGIIQAVRVVAHKETPGLGDYIELAKSNWILQFNGKSLQEPHTIWAVKKERGTFDYVSGATISPRAVIKAVHRTLEFIMIQHQRFFEASS